MNQTFRRIPTGEIHPHPDNPFGVREDRELQESVGKYGVLEPLMVRPRTGGGYEIISGHRRRAAAQMAGEKEVPAIVCNWNDIETAVALVDSNLHREQILPSEKAKAYKMKLDALKKQGERTAVDNSSTKAQTDRKSLDVGGADSLSTRGQSALATNNLNGVDNSSTVRKTRDSIAVNESGRQVQRYVRLLELIPKILQMVDEGKIAFSPAVEVSHLTKNEQADLLETMQSEDRTPNLSQCQRMKKLSAAGQLDMDRIFTIMTEEKANQKEQLKFKVDDLRPFFKKNVDAQQMEKVIMRLLGEYQRKWERQRNEHSRDAR